MSVTGSKLVVVQADLGSPLTRCVFALRTMRRPGIEALFRTPVSELRRTLLAMSEDAVRKPAHPRGGCMSYPEELQADLAEEQAISSSN